MSSSHLRHPASLHQLPASLTSRPVPTHSMDLDADDQWVDEAQDAISQNQIPDNIPAKPVTTPPKNKRLAPNHATVNLYTKWQALLPSLVEPFLAFTTESIGKPAQVVGGYLEGSCQSGGVFCEVKETPILCLYFDHIYHRHRIAYYSDNALQILKRLTSNIARVAI